MGPPPIRPKPSVSQIFQSMLNFFKGCEEGGHPADGIQVIQEQDEDVAEPDVEADLQDEQQLLIESENALKEMEEMNISLITPMWRAFLKLQLQNMRVKLRTVEQTRNLPGDLNRRVTELLQLNWRLIRAFDGIYEEMGVEDGVVPDDDPPPGASNDSAVWMPLQPVHQSSGPGWPLSPWDPPAGPSLVPTSWQPSRPRPFSIPPSLYPPPRLPPQVPASRQPTQPLPPGSQRRLSLPLSLFPSSQLPRQVSTSRQPTPPNSPGIPRPGSQQRRLSLPSFPCPPTRVPAQSSETSQPMYKSQATWHPRSHGARPSGLSSRPSTSPRDQVAPPSPRTPPQWSADPLTSSDDEVGTVFVIPRRAARETISASDAETLLNDFVEDAFVRNDTLNPQQALARSAELQGRLRELRTLEHEEGVSRYNLQFGYYRLAQGLLNRIDELTYNIDFVPKPPIIIYEDEEEPLASVMQTLLLNVFCNLAFDETYLLTGEDAHERLVLVRDALNKLNELEETENVSQYSLQFGYDRLATALINTIQELEWLDPESATASFLNSTAHELLERTPI